MLKIVVGVFLSTMFYLVSVGIIFFGIFIFTYLFFYDLIEGKERFLSEESNSSSDKKDHK